jgi:hypothetical protein
MSDWIWVCIWIAAWYASGVAGVVMMAWDWSRNDAADGLKMMPIFGPIMLLMGIASVLGRVVFALIWKR